MRNRVWNFSTYRSLARMVLFALFSISIMFGIQACKPRQTPTKLDNAFRAGSKDYDDYVKAGRLNIAVEHKLQADSPLQSSELKLTGAISNNGDRVVTGIELHAYAVDLEGKPMVDDKKKKINDQVHIWMPNQLRPGPMKPGETDPFQLIVANVPTKKVNEIGDLRIEISAVTFAK